MRFLVGMGIFEEAGEGIFASTPLSRVYMSNSPYAQAVIHMFVIVYRPHGKANAPSPGLRRMRSFPVFPAILRSTDTRALAMHTTDPSNTHETRTYIASTGLLPNLGCSTLSMSPWKYLVVILAYAGSTSSLSKQSSVLNHPPPRSWWTSVAVLVTT